MCPGAGAREVAGISRLKEAYFFDDIPSLALFDGIPALFATIKQQGKHICIASSNDNRTIDAIMRHVNLHDVVDGFTGLDDMARARFTSWIAERTSERTSVLALVDHPADALALGGASYQLADGRLTPAAVPVYAPVGR